MKCTKKDCVNEACHFYKLKVFDGDYIIERCSEHQPLEAEILKYSIVEISDDKFIILQSMNQ